MDSFLLLCFLSALLFSLSLSLGQDQYYVHHFCSNNGKNNSSTASSTDYQSSLSRLFTSLVSSSASLLFNNITVANDEDRVYGMYQCRGDVSTPNCNGCVEAAIEDIIKFCDRNRMLYYDQSIVWREYCMVRYSSHSFASTMVDHPIFHSYHGQNGSENQRSNFVNISTRWMTSLATIAAFGSGSHMFASGKADLGESNDEKIYGLVQCTPDLSKVDCNECLGSAISYFVSCCSGRTGVSVLAPSCTMRYEIYPFYQGHATPAAASKTGRTNKSSRIALITGVPIVSVVVLIVFLAYSWWKKKRIQKDKENSQEVLLLEFGRKSTKELNGRLHKKKTSELPFVHLDVIKAATNNFSNINKLGRGGFGSVYKGLLHDGKEIAVKRLDSTSGQGLEEFKNEVILISKLQHRNLVRLLGCCVQGGEKLLIYEFMLHTSLDVFLYNQDKRALLDWGRRLNIIWGITRGLLYLHEDSRLKIIHRDLKASNILLDHEMNPKISDFGMARIVEVSQNKSNTNRVVGTYGYMAPEYAMGGIFSVKSDVFSFGVLLLEIISGKRNSGFYLSEHPAQSLFNYAWKLWCEGKGLDLMDPLLGKSYVTSEVLRCIHVGLLCVQEEPAERPTMSSVVLMLGSSSISLPQPMQPAFSVGRTVAESNHSARNADQTCSINEITLSVASPR